MSNAETATITKAREFLSPHRRAMNVAEVEWFCEDLANAVSTEPDRTRAAVVKALREAADDAGRRRTAIGAAVHIDMRADAIENGADF